MRFRRLAPIALLVGGLAAAPAVAVAGHGVYALGPPVLVSGPSTLVGCPIGSAGATSVNYPNTEVEPFVSVDPTNPNHVVGAFQQDRWNDGGAKGLTAAVSFDGGATWTRNQAEFSACTNGDPRYLRTTDPWVSLDAVGRPYQNALSIDSAALGLSADLAATSDDGGLSWNRPVVIIEDDNPIEFNDKNSLTADWRPGDGAGKAYATWIRGDLPGFDHLSPVGAANSFAYTGVPMFSKTEDGGRTWSTPKSMVNSIIYIQGNQIAVLPDGTLVNVGAVLFRGSGIQPTQSQYFWTALRSTNGGKTWGAPIKVAPLGTRLLTNPDIPNPTSLNQTVRAGDYIPDVAVDHATGAIYMVFADGIASGFNHVKLTRSTDGGKSWSTPVDVTGTPAGTHSFNGTVEVTDDGTVAVMYYDFRRNTSAAGLPTDVWLTHSSDGGATWTEQHVYGPFDMENAPVARGWFLGDYQGLAPMQDDLLMFFSVATAQDDSADVIAVRALAP